jgi:hypothetical protein
MAMAEHGCDQAAQQIRSFVTSPCFATGIRKCFEPFKEATPPRFSHTRWLWVKAGKVNEIAGACIWGVPSSDEIAWFVSSSSFADVDGVVVSMRRLPLCAFPILGGFLRCKVTYRTQSARSPTSQRKCPLAADRPSD